jgi:hypothetical protein
VVNLTDIDPVKSYADRSQQENEYDEDEEGGPGGQRVQCAQQ